MKLLFFKITLTILILCLANVCFSQKVYKSPKKAALLSILPGAGQVYTKKYWKIPIIYSGLIYTAFQVNDNNKKYNLYKNLYLDRSNGILDSSPHNNSQLITLKDQYRRNREVSIMLFSLTYILNIIDASVNAHLFDFEINEDISLKIQPILFQKNFYSSINLNLNLK
ncbi:MAG: DUF5683 domain-containing protein [Flavobacteriales bacterium]